MYFPHDTCFSSKLSPSRVWGVRVNQLDIVELASQPPDLMLKKLDPLLERYKYPE